MRNGGNRPGQNNNGNKGPKDNGNKANAQAGVNKSADGTQHGDKKKRNRIKKDRVDVANTPGTNYPRENRENRENREKREERKQRLKKPVKTEVSEEDVQKQIKETLARY